MDTLTDATSLQRIEEILEQIRPAVRADGGDIEFLGFDPIEGVVSVRLVGACYDCPMATATLRAGIEQRLCMAIPDVKAVEAVE